MGHFLLLEKTCLIIGLASYYVDMSFFVLRVFFSKYFLSALSPAQMKIVTHYRQTHFWRSLQNLSSGDELQSTPSQTRRITRKKWKKCKFLLRLIFQTSKYSCLVPFPCHDTAYMFNCFCSEHFDEPAWQIPQCPTDHTIFGVLWQFLREIISKLQMKSDPKSMILGMTTRWLLKLQQLLGQNWNRKFSRLQHETKAFCLSRLQNYLENVEAVIPCTPPRWRRQINEMAYRVTCLRHSHSHLMEWTQAIKRCCPMEKS